MELFAVHFEIYPTLADATSYTNALLPSQMALPRASLPYAQYARAATSRSVPIAFSWCTEGLSEIKLPAKHLRPRASSAATPWCSADVLIVACFAHSRVSRATSWQKRFQRATPHGAGRPPRSEIPAYLVGTAITVREILRRELRPADRRGRACANESELRASEGVSNQ